MDCSGIPSSFNPENPDSDRKKAFIACRLPRLTQMPGLAMTGYERQGFIGIIDHSNRE
jgi:hypothetical protein